MLSSTAQPSGVTSSLDCATKCIRGMHMLWLFTFVGQYVRPLDRIGTIHANLPELCSLTAHIVCTAKANCNVGKLCHSLLRNCSLHTLCFLCVSVDPFEHINNFHVSRPLCRAGSVFNSCGMQLQLLHHSSSLHHPTFMKVKSCCSVMQQASRLCDIAG